MMSDNTTKLSDYMIMYNSKIKIELLLTSNNDNNKETLLGLLVKISVNCNPRSTWTCAGVSSSKTNKKSPVMALCDAKLMNIVSWSIVIKALIDPFLRRVNFKTNISMFIF